jgi:hypothetical protein
VLEEELDELLELEELVVDVLELVLDDEVVDLDVEVDVEVVVELLAVELELLELLLVELVLVVETEVEVEVVVVLVEPSPIMSLQPTPTTLMGRPAVSTNRSTSTSRSVSAPGGPIASKVTAATANAPVGCVSENAWRPETAVCPGARSLKTMVKNRGRPLMITGTGSTESTRTTAGS